MQLDKKIVEFLKQNAEKKYTAREIAEWIFKQYPKECAAKKERAKNITTDAELIQQLVREIASQRARVQRNYPQIKTTEEYPRKYYFTTQSDQAEIEEIETSIKSPKGLQNKTRLSEHDLYPILSSFLWNVYGIFPKRINEKRSSNIQGVNGNKWLYPDLVAMEDLTSNWNQKIKDCVKEYSDKKTKLWSFEVKLLINRSNIREAFFQTVSNSSWANYGYLVASSLNSNAKKELQILSSLHGIGFILLNSANEAESQILIPARERNEIDWDTADRLIKENKDFKSFINEVTRFYQTGETRIYDWDIGED